MITYAAPNQQPLSPMPSRESTCTQQISTVLMVMRELQPYLLTEIVDIGVEHRPDLDGGAGCAAMSTFVKACSRLDEMLDDKTRWNLKENDELYQAITEQMKTAAEVNRNQVEAIKRIQSPAVRLKPALTTVAGEFIAFHSTSNLPGGTIIGKGKTPSAALEDFNAAFERIVEQQLRFAAASEARLKAQPEAPAPIENKRKKRKSGY